MSTTTRNYPSRSKETLIIQLDLIKLPSFTRSVFSGLLTTDQFYLNYVILHSLLRSSCLLPKIIYSTRNAFKTPRSSFPRLSKRSNKSPISDAVIVQVICVAIYLPTLVLQTILCLNSAKLGIKVGNVEN